MWIFFGVFSQWGQLKNNIFKQESFAVCQAWRFAWCLHRYTYYIHSYWFTIIGHTGLRNIAKARLAPCVHINHKMAALCWILCPQCFWSVHSAHWLLHYIHKHEGQKPITILGYCAQYRPHTSPCNHMMGVMDWRASAQSVGAIFKSVFSVVTMVVAAM